MAVAPVFEESIDSKVCRAVRDLINADPFFSVYYAGKCRYIPPLISDDHIDLPDIMVQDGLERDLFVRMIGNVALATTNVKITLWDPETTEEFHDGEDPARNIVNRLTHLERVLETGTLGPENTGQGKIIDPDSAPGDPGTVRFLNVKAPAYSRTASQRLDISKARDRSSLAMVYPLLVSYTTQQDRRSRRSS